MVGDGWQIGLPRGGRPSTHILKTPISGLPATVLNEAFCLRVGARLGMRCASAEPRRVGETAMLLVERYDRALSEGKTVRLHQEDFCQALGVESSRKYESEGGPKLVGERVASRGARTLSASLGTSLSPRLLSFRTFQVPRRLARNRSAQAEIAQKGNLRVSVPGKLPRRSCREKERAPIAVSVLADPTGASSQKYQILKKFKAISSEALLPG
ncbi:MAG TPA: HipA domain-containing protein [Solirubrobacterales bacterium]|nr:HipA domain-containing protein [Solirubrobacterales bacterium]